MALSTARVSVTTTQALLQAGITHTTRTFIQLTNLGPHTAWLGPTGVTTANGFPLYVGRTIRSNNLQGLQNEQIYAISGPTETASICVLEAS
jgi:hypothetical protein